MPSATQMMIRRPKRTSNNFFSGFTVLEVLIVVFIASAVFGALFMMMSAGRTSWYSSDVQIALQQELRKAMRQISDDIRESGGTQMSLPANNINYSSISFNVSEGVLGSGLINWSSNPIDYSLSSGQIIRTEGSAMRVIANNITTMNFRRLASASDIVQIYLTSRKTSAYGRILNASTFSAVMMRN